MMPSVKIQKIGGKWVILWMTRLHEFRFDTDTIEWVSMGIHPDGAVRITTDFDGQIESVVLVKSDEEVLELDIPSNHSLARMVTVLKPYKQVIPNERNQTSLAISH